MKVDIKVPSVGESVTEATVGEWSKKNGEAVKRDDVLLVLETDKASVEVVAEQDGVLSVLAKQGDVVQVGAVVGQIDSAGTAQASATPPLPAKPQSPAAKPSEPSRPPPSVSASNGHGGVDVVQPLSPAVRRAVNELGVTPQSVTGTGKDGRLTKGDVLSAATAAPVKWHNDR